MESEALETFNAYADPLVLIYLSIGVAIFAIYAYRIAELRVFIVPIVALWFSIFFMWVEIHDAEAVALMISGVTSVFSVLYYRYKTKIGIYGGR